MKMKEKGDKQSERPVSSVEQHKAAVQAFPVRSGCVLQHTWLHGGGYELAL